MQITQFNSDNEVGPGFKVVILSYKERAVPFPRMKLFPQLEALRMQLAIIKDLHEHRRGNDRN